MKTAAELDREILESQLSPGQRKSLAAIRAHGSVVKRFDTFTTKGLHTKSVTELVKLGLVEISQGQPFVKRVGRQIIRGNEKIYTAL